MIQVANGMVNGRLLPSDDLAREDAVAKVLMVRRQGLLMELAEVERQLIQAGHLKRRSVPTRKDRRNGDGRLGVRI